MCIKLHSDGSEFKYNASIPLEDQIQNCQRVEINYEPKDPDVESFLNEMERLCKSGISCDVKVELKHNNTIRGAKAKKQLQRLKKDLKLNEAIKILVNLYSEIDKALEEISGVCRKK